MNVRSSSMLSAKWLKCLLFMVIALIYIRACSVMLIKSNGLMHIKCC
jgi:hypothetical protein